MSYILHVYKNVWLGVPDDQSEHIRRAGTKRWHHRRHVGITTGVIVRSLSVVDGDYAGYDTTLPETQVGLMRVDAGR